MTTPTPSAGAAALAVVDAFVSAFNVQDHAAIAASFNFPHVRLVMGRFFRFETAADYLAYGEERHAGLSKEAWHHTTLHQARVVQAAADKVHLALTYDRCHADGTVYNRFDSLWIATLVDGHWGIQFRSSFIGAAPPPPGTPPGTTPGVDTAALDAAEAGALAAVEAFRTAFRAQDYATWAGALHYPHLRLAKGRFEHYETPEAFLARRPEVEATLKNEAWHTTVTRSTEVVHRSPEKVHVAIGVERLRADGTPYNRFETLWIPTLREGRWGVQFRSSYLRS